MAEQRENLKREQYKLIQSEEQRETNWNHKEKRLNDSRYLKKKIVEDVSTLMKDTNLYIQGAQ